MGVWSHWRVALREEETPAIEALRKQRRQERQFEVLKKWFKEDGPRIRKLIETVRVKQLFWMPVSSSEYSKLELEFLEGLEEEMEGDWYPDDFRSDPAWDKIQDGIREMIQDIRPLLGKQTGLI